MDKTLSEVEDQSLVPALRDKIGTMVGLIDTTIHVVRRISSELRPPILDDLGLAAAIEWQMQQFQARTGILCQYDGAGEYLDLDQGQSTAIFRIFQEALTNVLRHAQATRVDVTLEEQGAELVLKIRDNGRGITEDEQDGLRTLGLLGMRERAHLIGGRVELTGIRGQGTTVTLRVPHCSDQRVKGRGL
jgi:signal transduction histidine kinase